MNVVMAGIDYSMAGIDIREKFSFSKSIKEKIYNKIKENKNILGSVIISTCNRTEIYFSCEEGYEVNPFKAVCGIIGVDFFQFENMHKTRHDNFVIDHLCKLACGVKSQIWGEDQIITQVKESLDFARENKSCDSILEVLFRNAITAAKKVKTNLKLSFPQKSIADKALGIIENELDNYANVLVIGNGEIGKLVASLLVERGFNVTMTLRSYKYSIAEVPKGVKTVDYMFRYEEMSKSHIVISATVSPHYTVEFNKVIEMDNIPKIFIDLAVPRDIEVEISKIEDVKCYDVDSICKDDIEKNHWEQLREIEKIIFKYVDDFEKWYSYKERILV